MITAHSLVIESSEDLICPGDSEKLAKGIPGAQLVNLEGQAHMPHFEKPKEFANAILKFLGV
jgi:3-oxoadipate enol-lactonase